MIEHLSYSGIRLFNSNPHQFYQVYVLNGLRTKYPAMLAGSAFHKTMEHYFITGEVDLQIGIDLIFNEQEGVDRGKQSVDDILTQFGQGMDNYISYNPDKPTLVEEGYIVQLGEHLQFKGYIDQVFDDNKGCYLKDMKLVKNFTDPTTIPGREKWNEYQRQAGFYMLGYELKTGRRPEYVEMVEVLKGKPRIPSKYKRKDDMIAFCKKNNIKIDSDMTVVSIKGEVAKYLPGILIHTIPYSQQLIDACKRKFRETEIMVLEMLNKKLISCPLSFRSPINRDADCNTIRGNEEEGDTATMPGIATQVMKDGEIQGGGVIDVSDSGQGGQDLKDITIDIPDFN